MSGDPDDTPDEEHSQPREQPQGGQPEPREQPQGGQPEPREQPQGGQPQPHGGQSQGQPQGQPRGGQPQQAGGGGMGDIFNREDTQRQLKIGLVTFVAVGIGLGLATLLGEAFEDVVIIGSLTAAALTPLVAVVVAQPQTNALIDVEDNLVYGTTAITALIGAFLMSFLVWLFVEIAADAQDFGDIFLIWLGAAIGSAVAAAIVAFAHKNL